MTRAGESGVGVVTTVTDSGRKVYVECPRCKAKGQVFDGARTGAERKAIAAWNEQQLHAVPRSKSTPTLDDFTTSEDLARAFSNKMHDRDTTHYVLINTPTNRKGGKGVMVFNGCAKGEAELLINTLECSLQHLRKQYAKELGGWNGGIDLGAAGAFS
jgi:hypothetical protein